MTPQEHVKNQESLFKSNSNVLIIFTRKSKKQSEKKKRLYFFVFLFDNSNCFTKFAYITFYIHINKTILP